MDNSNSTTNDNSFVAGSGAGSDDISDEQLLETIKGMTFNELIDNYAEGMIVEQGMSALDDDLKADLKKDIVERVNAEMNGAIVDALPDDKLDEFDEMLGRDGTTSDDIQKYLVDSGIDVGAVVTKAFEKVHQDFIGEYAGALDTEE